MSTLADPNELLTYCMTAQRLGLSANKALELYRLCGLTVRRQRFYETWRAGVAADHAFPISRAVA